MRCRKRVARASCLLLWGVALWGTQLWRPPAVSAQPTLAHATEAQQALARDEYQRGLRAFDAGRHDEALQAFEASYAAVASPNTQLMLARCLVKLEQPAAAYRAYSEVTEMAGVWGNERYAQSAQSAQEEMQALKPQIVMLMLDIDDPTGEARLRVGDQQVPRAQWHRPYATDPGQLAVELTSGDAADRRVLALEPGVAAMVELRLPEVPESEEEVAARAPQPAPEAVQRPSSSGGLRTASYISTGVGAAGLIAFGVLGSMATARFEDIERACPSHDGCDPALRERAQSGQELQTGANIALVAGGVCLAAGVTLFVLSLDEQDAEIEVSARGATLRGRF